MLWEFCDTLEEIQPDNFPFPFDVENLLTELQEQLYIENERPTLMLTSTCLQSCACASTPASEYDKDILAELPTLSETMTRSTSSNSEVLTVSPIPPLPVFTTDTNKTSTVITGGLLYKLPPMYKTKLDCPRDGGCSINVVKSLPGGSTCKGKNSIGSKHKFICRCGLKWQENNWRERERLCSLGESDTRCIQFLPIQQSKQSRGAIAKARKFVRG